MPWPGWSYPNFGLSCSITIPGTIHCGDRSGPLPHPGPQVSIFHRDNVEGFKAGALNLALELTSRRAEIIAVIDSDYQVDPDWLRIAMPAHSRTPGRAGTVPAGLPRWWRQPFQAVDFREYAGFFRIGMVERRHNAIVQHGTMCLMRREALEAVGGWAVWSITARRHRTGTAPVRGRLCSPLYSALLRARANARYL